MILVGTFPGMSTGTIDSHFVPYAREFQKNTSQHSSPLGDKGNIFSSVTTFCWNCNVVIRVQEGWKRQGAITLAGLVQISFQQLQDSQPVCNHQLSPGRCLSAKQKSAETDIGVPLTCEKHNQVLQLPWLPKAYMNFSVYQRNKSFRSVSINLYWNPHCKKSS